MKKPDQEECKKNQNENLECREDKKNRMLHMSVCIVFTAFLFLFMILSMASRDRLFSSSENRILAKRPIFSFSNLFHGNYTEEYETYLSDQFIYRDSFVSIKTFTEASLLKKELNGIYLSDGYLIEAFHPEDVDTKLMQENEKTVAAFADKYAGILGKDHMKVMLVPTASDILSEKLPKYTEVFQQQAVADRLKEQLGGEILIDVSKVLKEHSKEYIFYRTDHHWTTKGAYYAYRIWAEQSGFVPVEEQDFIIEEVSDDFRGTVYSKINLDFVEPDKIYLYQSSRNYQVEYDLSGEKNDSLYEMSHLETKDQYAVFLDGNHAVAVIDGGNAEGDGRKLLVIKDSYGHSFVPFAAEHYDSVYMVDMRYFNVPFSSWIEEQGFTDILVLYNIKTFMSETTVNHLLW